MEKSLLMCFLFACFQKKSNGSVFMFTVILGGEIDCFQVHNLCSDKIIS